MANSILVKSLIFDFADAHNSTDYLAFRSAELFLGAVRYDLEQADYSTYASSGAGLAAYGFDTTIAKTGTGSLREFRSGNGTYANVRLILVLNTPMTIDSIVMNNRHHYGDYTYRGVKNTVITVSPSEVVDTTFGAAVADGTGIFSGVIPEHIASDVEDDYTLPLTIPDPPPDPEKVRFLVDQVTLLGVDEIRTLFRQSDGVTESVRTLIDQLCESALQLRAECSIVTGLTVKQRAELIQTYKSLEVVRAELEQLHSIAGGAVRAELSQVYDLEELDKVRAELEQIYLMAAGDAIILRDEVTITAILDGKTYPIESDYNYHDEADLDSYHLAGQLLLADEAEFNLCQHHKTIIEVDDNGELMRFMVENPKRNDYEDGRSDFIVDLVSESVLLDALPVVETGFSGMTKDIVAGLAAPVCAVDWRLPNWPISINVSGESALGLIRRIVQSVKGVVQPGLDGTLICKPEYQHDMDKLNQYTPDFTLVDQDDLFQITESDSPRDGFNAFYVTDQAVTDDGVRIEVEDISGSKKLVKVFLLPWDKKAKVTLHHSGGGWVSIVKGGVVEQLIEAERVEFVNGSGQTMKPCYGNVTVDYDERDLGSVSFLEDGTLTAAAAENSLAKITYLTKYHSFEVRSPLVENVQVYPEVAYE